MAMHVALMRARCI